MKKQEEIREYFEIGLCSDLSQEYCSGCNFSRKNGDYCETVKERVTGTLKVLSDLGCVIKVDKELPASRANEGLRFVNWDDGYRHAEARYKLAGYVATEPLIELCPTCGKDVCKCPTINRGSFAKYVED